MNVNLHIERIVLEGVELAAGDDQLLQQAVMSQLTEMLMQQGIGSQADFAQRYKVRSNSIRIGQAADTMSLAPQLAGAIYANIPPSLMPIAANEGHK